MGTVKRGVEFMEGIEESSRKKPKSCNGCRSQFPSLIKFYEHRKHCKFDCICMPCLRKFQYYTLLWHHNRRCTKTNQRRRRNRKLLLKNLSSAKSIFKKQEKPSPSEETQPSQQKIEVDHKSDFQTKKIKPFQKNNSLKKNDCKCCHKIFTTAIALEKHFNKNTICAKVHKLKDVKPGGKSIPANEAFDSTSSDEIEPAKKARKTLPSSQKFSKSEYSCSLCSTYFSSFSELQKHKEMHYEEDQRKCPRCSVIFKDKSSLFQHQKTANHWGKTTNSLNPTCQCPICDKEFVLTESRNVHLNTHKETHADIIQNFLKKTTCQECFQIFPTEIVTLQHVKLIHTKKKVAETKQKSRSPSKTEKALLSHKYIGYTNKKVMVKITPEIKQQLKLNPTTCPVCFRKYSSSFIRNRHFRVHTLEHAFECKFCPTKFSRSELLTNHLQQKHNDRLAYECKECSLRFFSRIRALQHGNKVHPEYLADTLIKQRHNPPFRKKMPSIENEIYIPEEEFFCESCDLSFLKLCGLTRHKQSKLHREIFLKFGAQNLLNPLHVPPKKPLISYQQTQRNPDVIGSSIPQSVENIDVKYPIKCTGCADEFNSIADFVPHRMNHFAALSKEKPVDELNPYLCEICSKELTSHQKIQIHLFWHLQNAPEESKVCRSNFNIPKKLSGQPVAKKSFPKSLSKTDDFLLGGISAKALFTCQHCGIGFTTKHQCNNHIEKHCRLRKKQVTEVNLEPPASPPIEKPKEAVPNKTVVPLKCIKCSFKFETTSELENHVKTCRPHPNVSKSIVYCQTCNCIFGTSELYDDHKVMYCNDREFKPTIDIDSQKVGALAINMQPKFNIACVDCNIVFEVMRMLAGHMNKHKIKIVEANGNSTTATSSIPKDDVLSIIKEEKISCVEPPQETGPPSLKDTCVAKLTSESTKEPNVCQTVPETSSGILNEEQLDISLVKEEQLIMDVDEEAPFEMNDFADRDDTNQPENDIIRAGNIAHVLHPGGITEDFDPSYPIKEEPVDPTTVQSELSLQFGKNLIPEMESLPPLQVIDILRHNFSSLFSILLSDTDVMQQLGFGEKLIDDVLHNALLQMELTPVSIEDDSFSELERLRKNIRILLNACIKDHVMELISDEETEADAIVIEALKMFGAEVEEHHVQLVA